MFGKKHQHASAQKKGRDVSDRDADDFVREKTLMNHHLFPPLATSFEPLAFRVCLLINFHNLFPKYSVNLVVSKNNWNPAFQDYSHLCVGRKYVGMSTQFSSFLSPSFLSFHIPIFG